MGRAALATFNVEGIHPTDISTILDSVSGGGLLGRWQAAWRHAE